MTKLTPHEITQRLRMFTGSVEWTKWSPLFDKDVLTEGAVFLAQECGAYWLMDAIASHQPEINRAARSARDEREEFQVWHLRRHESQHGQWLLTADDGNAFGLASQHIEYSDFPLDSIKLYAVRNELGGVTIMLPSEY